ncbi:MAG: cell division protein FtsZ [Rickettsiaceae bacterium]
MTLNLKAQESVELESVITVMGVGGAGGNSVNNMINANLQGVNFILANTDAQALKQSLCNDRIQLGVTLTQGLGAGASPDVGAMAAEESINDIRKYLEGSHMLFITAGMGGGTGTGASSVIAKAAKELGILTVAVVTMPFNFEGNKRKVIAEGGLKKLRDAVDTLIIIPNQNLFRIANENTTFSDAFKIADDVLHAGVRGITDLIVMPGLINLDFADIKSVMSEMGNAMMGTGEASGENRAVAAAESAISNPLLDSVSMGGAKGVLINITGGQDMTLFEVDTAANRIRDEIDSDANIIFGSAFNDSMEGIIRVSVVATGIDNNKKNNTEVSKPDIKEELPRFNQYENIVSDDRAQEEEEIASSDNVNPNLEPVESTPSNKDEIDNDMLANFIIQKTQLEKELEDAQKQSSQKPKKSLFRKILNSLTFNSADISNESIKNQHTGSIKIEPSSAQEIPSLKKH